MKSIQWNNSFKTLVKALLLSVFLSLSVQSQAQQLKVATGGAKGTYSALFKEIASRCGTLLPFIEQNTSGSMENMDLLLGNQINGAFVQTDVLFFRARSEDLSGIKTLLALHPEEVHVLALNVTYKEGGTTVFGKTIGGNEVVIKNVSDLSNRVVGAAGGSFISAQIIRLQSEIPFTVKQYDDGSKVLAALKSGEIQAGLFVGGSPLGDLKDLGPEFKLLSFGEDTVGKLKGVYRPAKISYTKMGTSSTGVQTIATDALFVTREYKTPKMVEGLALLRSCVLSSLDELKETTGTHPKWQTITVDNKGKWAWYNLPTTTKKGK